MYDENDRLTRAGAEQVIRDGGTVHLTRRTLNPDGSFKTVTREYKTIQSLPSEVEFAVDDRSAHQKALEGLKAQREQLDAQEQKILEQAKAQDAARKDAEKAQKAREKAQGDQPPQTLHQQTGGRQLSGAENPLAEQEANEQAERAKAAAEAADPRRQQQPQRQTRQTAAADDDDAGAKTRGHGHK